MTSSPEKNRLETSIIPGDRQFLEEIIDRAPDGMALVTASLVIEYYNQACIELFGDHRYIIIGQTFLDVVDARDRARFDLAVVQLLLVPGERMRVEARILRPDGQSVWMLVQLSAVRLTREGGVEQIFVQLTDIDRQKQAEISTEILEERWHNALVGSNLGVWDHDFTTGEYYYSTTWKALRGLAPDEEIDPALDVWIDTVHPDDREFVLGVIERQNIGELNYSEFEYRQKHRDGRWVWIKCRGSCIEWDADGRPTRIVGTDTDVTPRKAAEEKLSHLSRRLELALEVSRIGVFEADTTLNTSLWDERMLSIYGLEEHGSFQDADSWKTLIHPDDKVAALERIAVNGAAKTSFTNEFRIIRPDGKIRHIRARVAPMGDAEQPTRFIGANWDVTDDIVIQQELERAKILAEARNAQLEAAKARIEHDALHDFLTDLPNRRYLDTMLAGWTQDCVGRRSGMAVMHLDLDRFKQINDTLGHQTGDLVLQHAAAVLRDLAGPGDFVARIGGDEFAILSPLESSPSKCSRLAERIIRRLCEPVHLGGHMCRIGASIGIAYDKKCETDARQLLLNADIALYRAKSQGRNRFEFFSSDVQNKLLDTKRVSDEILTGLETNAFIPYYQPQFHAKSLDLAGVETLARWLHPTLGIMTPDNFLWVAEDLDVVASIDAIILDKALVDFARWRAAGIDVPNISVNVSARRLSDPGFVAKLGKIEFTPGTLSFELLESIFLDHCDELVVGNLRAIRESGIAIEIDDFGTGHASIVSLLKIGPGTFKIDRELIRPITEIREQRKLVGSIIEIGKSLNIRVVAEGVETAEHVSILQDLGCDILQGFALARPMPFDEIEDFVRKEGWRL